MPKDSLIRLVFSLGKKENVTCPVRLGGYPIFTAPGDDESGMPGTVIHLTEDGEGRPCLVAALMKDPSTIVAYQLPLFELAHVLSHEYNGEGLTGCDGFAVTLCPDTKPS